MQKQPLMQFTHKQDFGMGSSCERIQELTACGHRYLSNKQYLDALASFQQACEVAQDINDGYKFRACSFNLGTCYIACGEPMKGLHHLERAIPPVGEDDGKDNFADLWYNIGIAKHATNDISGAVIAYQSAQHAYHDIVKRNLEAECLSKLAVCHELLERPIQAADTFHSASSIYAGLGDHQNEASCLLNEVHILSMRGSYDQCSKVVSELLDVCQNMTDKHVQGKIYHSIGLIYASAKLYDSAAQCFDQALKSINLMQQRDRNLEAVILQNLGVVCNCMNMYPRAASFHRMSADLYGELGERSLQTQVFSSLAYAYTQMGQYVDACTAFSHAVQAAKDSRDKEAECLATEGLAAVYFRIKDFQRAVASYKEALRLIALTASPKVEIADRIVEKLADAIRSQMKNMDQNVVALSDGKAMPETRNSATESLSKGMPRHKKTNRASMAAKGLACETSSVEDLSEHDSCESIDSSSSAATHDKSKVSYGAALHLEPVRGAASLPAVIKEPTSCDKATEHLEGSHMKQYVVEASNKKPSQSRTCCIM